MRSLLTVRLRPELRALLGEALGLVFVGGLEGADVVKDGLLRSSKDIRQISVLAFPRIIITDPVKNGSQLRDSHTPLILRKQLKIIRIIGLFLGGWNIYSA